MSPGRPLLRTVDTDVPSSFWFETYVRLGDVSCMSQTLLMLGCDLPGSVEILPPEVNSADLTSRGVMAGDLIKLQC